MLELKERTEEESRNYMEYDSNLLFQYEMVVMMARYDIKHYGIKVFLGEEEGYDKEGKMVKVLDIPMDEKKCIYRYLQRYPDFTDKQIARELFRECEYFPR